MKKNIKFIEKIKNLLLERVTFDTAKKSTNIDYDHKSKTFTFTRNRMKYILNLIKENEINITFSFSHENTGDDFMPNTKLKSNRDIDTISFFNDEINQKKIQKDVSNILKTLSNWLQKVDFDPKEKLAVIKDLFKNKKEIAKEIINNINSLKK